jgi:hypothetical protein
MSQNDVSGQNNKKKKKRLVNKNFLEALTELGGGVAKSAVRDLAGGVAEASLNQVTNRQISGELKPDQPVEVVPTPQEAQLERQTERFHQEYLDINRQEKLVYKETERETRMQIAVVLEELKKLSVSTKKLAKEVEIAAHQVPEPGVYHLNFFTKLRQTLKSLRKKIDDSSTWLSAFNQRAGKKGYYWGQVKKSGTKFMLSQERYMATQAG